MLAAIRAYFQSHSVLEVETPLFSSAGTTDPSIESFSAKGGRVVGYLATSPEFHMKRLLAAGSGDIYQISRSFRVDEAGSNHNPEFSMLEWYRHGINHMQLAQELVDLIQCLTTADAIEAVEYVSYKQLFKQSLDIKLDEVSSKQLHSIAVQQGVATETQLPRDETLDLLLAMVVFEQLPAKQLTIVYDYPASQASLARIDVQDPTVASRFELLWGGLEIANGYHELREPDEQQFRFEKDNAIRKEKGQQSVHIDHNLIQALNSGLPDCAGVAVGLDRLLMKLTGSTDIRRVINFPVDRA